MKRFLWLIAILLALVGAVIGYIASVPAFGKHAKGRRLARMEESPQWKDGKFENYEPMWSNLLESLRRGLVANPTSSPSVDVPRVQSHGEQYAQAPATGLRVTWFGHSSTLIEIDEVRVLTDPIWGARASPVDWAGPKRWYEPVIPLDELPVIDAVLISHDHYDHLDMNTVSALAGKGVRFIVPLGIGAHLVYWGIPDDQISELDWWQDANIGPVDIHAVPARHASGRINPQANQTLFAGYAIVGPKHRAYFSGDTGYFAALAAVGEAFGPFDVTLIETGQYHDTWPDWHIGPEQAVAAHLQVHGKVMIPIHWGLFALSPHGWTEPVERALAAAKCWDVTMHTPKPGESIEPATATTTRWWPDVPWETGAQAPIIATRDGNSEHRFVLPPCTTSP